MSEKKENCSGIKKVAKELSEPVNWALAAALFLGAAALHDIGKVGEEIGKSDREARQFYKNIKPNTPEQPQRQIRNLSVAP